MTTMLDEDDAKPKHDDGEEVHETTDDSSIEEEMVLLVRGTIMTTKPSLYV